MSLNTFRFISRKNVSNLKEWIAASYDAVRYEEHDDWVIIEIQTTDSAETAIEKLGPEGLSLEVYTIDPWFGADYDSIIVADYRQACDRVNETIEHHLDQLEFDETFVLKVKRHEMEAVDYLELVRNRD